MGDPPREIAELVEESDAFERCPDCERYFAQTSNHRCRSDGTDGKPPNRAERRRRARADTRRDDTRVGIFGQNGSTTYAYHDIANGKPRCGCQYYAEAAEMEVVTLGRAKARGRSPCENCRRLR